MRTTIIYILLLVTFNTAYAQLDLNNKLKIVHNDKIGSLSEFIKYHKIDYALVFWSTSNWMNHYDMFSCLFRKDNQWSVVEIKSDAYPARDFPYVLLFKQKLLDNHEADSLLKKLKIDSAFYYKQADFDKLPEECSYKKDGKIYTSSIMDAGTSHLAQFVGNKVEYLTMYATDFHIEDCYPYAPEYGILKAFANTIRHLSKSVNDFAGKK